MNEIKPKRNIFILGLISMFSDLSSQMVYPLIPEFLVSIGANKAIVGVIEGIAESTASIFRTVFGKLSDKLKKRKLFIFLGYFLSTFSRPVLYLANFWTPVLAIRFSDRVGKAIRNPARDALISTSVDASKKGKAFGFQRAMDRMGAIGGPLLAILVLALFNNNIRFVFLLSVIPGIFTLFFLKFVKETAIVDKTDTVSQRHSLRNAPFIIFLISNIIFTLGNSSNAFLILRAREAGLSIAMIPVIWIVYNLFCSISAPIFGSLSDRVGRKPIIIVSFLYYSFVYFLFGMADRLWLVWILFGAYGIYYGLSNGIFRAYIADLVEPENRATAYGIFNTGIGLALFPASLIMGAVWDSLGSKWAFFISAGFSLLGFMIFMISLLLRKVYDKKSV
jgi:MFS family permease